MSTTLVISLHTMNKDEFEERVDETLDTIVDLMGSCVDSRLLTMEESSRALGFLRALRKADVQSIVDSQPRID